MVQVHLGPPRFKKIRNSNFEIRILEVGGVAQLGERLPCTQEVIGSIPFTSTKLSGG
jgi:hypothetical protein